jgi:hypothetical protein
MKLPITEKDISKTISRTIKSPILISNLDMLEIDPKEFLNYFKLLSSELPWDPYDVRRLQVEFLIKAFPKDKTILESRLPDYFTGKKDKRTYRKWINLLSKRKRAAFEAIQPWRRRSVSKFIIKETKRGLSVKRVAVPQFVQEVAADDIRSLPRVFEEAPATHVENEFFYHVMKKLFKVVQGVRANVGKKVTKVSMTAHFMSVKATSTHPGDNSPEGAHEDGADYIVSALVYNRFNLKGGQTQIIEMLPDGKKEIIFKHTLKPGEFVFQADTRDEITYGTDLWHHVTPFYISNPAKGEGWRDIIGFDINVEG